MTRIWGPFDENYGMRKLLLGRSFIKSMTSGACEDHHGDGGGPHGYGVVAQVEEQVRLQFSSISLSYFSVVVAAAPGLVVADRYIVPAPRTSYILEILMQCQ